MVYEQSVDTVRTEAIGTSPMEDVIMKEAKDQTQG